MATILTVRPNSTDKHTRIGTNTADTDTCTKEEQSGFYKRSNRPAKRNALRKSVDQLNATCQHILSYSEEGRFRDVDFLYWQRKLTNIATPISCAISEFYGCPRFHYHYKHDPQNDDVLIPVSGPSPLLTLAAVCREGIANCSEMLGLSDPNIRRLKEELERDMRIFQHRYTVLARKG